MRITLTDDQVNQIMELIGMESDGEIRTGYIGRGPTRPCLAVVGSLRDLLLVAWAVENLLPDELEMEAGEVREAFSAPSSDSMGTDTVFYWTNVTVE